MIEMLRSRRSIRKYSETPIDPQHLDLLKEALLRSPSSRGINPWEFVFVDNRDMLEKLSRSKQQGSAFLKGAPLGIVVCGDESKSDVWVEDCSIASILVQMTAHSLGLGSCWIQIRLRNQTESVTSERFIQGLLGIPEKYRIAAIISIGHPNEAKKPVPANKLDFGKIRENGWNVSKSR